MRYKLMTFYTSIINLIIVLFSINLSLAANNPFLEDISFEAVSATEERIIFKLSGNPVPVIFAIKGENPRVVFDFPNTRPAVTLNTNIETQGLFVKKIRTGFHKGEEPKTRVVFDLYPERLIDLDKVFHRKSKTLVVTVRPRKPSEKAEPTKKTPLVTESIAEQKETLPEIAAEKTTAPPQSAQGSTQKISAQGLDITHTDDTYPDEQVDTKVITAQKDTSPLLSSIKFDKNSDRGEMLLFKLNDFYPPVVFGIEDKLPRVVCDFMDTRVSNSVPSIIDCNGKYLKTVRVGIHNKPVKVRVVLDLAQKNNYDLQQVFFKEDNLFVIIINRFAEDETEPEKTDGKPRRGDRLNSF